MRRHAPSHFVQFSTSRSFTPACLLAALFLACGLVGCKNDESSKEGSRETARAGSNSSGSPAAEDRSAADSDSANSASASDSGDTDPAPADENPFRIRAFEGRLTEAPPEDAPVVVLTVSELASEVEEPDAAQEKYAGSWVEVTGTVEALDASYATSQYEWVPMIRVRQAEGEEDEEDPLLHCYLAAGEKPWENVSVGDQVTLRGVVYSFRDILGTLADCTVVSGGDPTPVMTVDEIIELHNADPEGFFEANKDKQAILTGIYGGQVAPSEEEDAEKWLAIDSESGSRLYIYIHNAIEFEEVEAGDPVWILASFRDYRVPESVNEVLRYPKYYSAFMPEDED